MMETIIGIFEVNPIYQIVWYGTPPTISTPAYFTPTPCLRMRRDFKQYPRFLSNSGIGHVSTDKSSIHFK
jgi:hypothetical protein